MVSSGFPSDTVGPDVYQRSCQWSPNHSTRQSRLSDNSHGQLIAVSHQYHHFRALKGHEKAIWTLLFMYSYSVVVSGLCMSIAIKLVNKRDSKLNLNCMCLHIWSIFPDLVTYHNLCFLNLHLYTVHQISSIKFSGQYCNIVL